MIGAAADTKADLRHVATPFAFALGFGACLLPLLGCDDSSTQFEVVVDSNIKAPELVGLRVEMQVSDEEFGLLPPERWLIELDSDHPLPQTFSVGPATGEPAQALELTIIGERQASCLSGGGGGCGVLVHTVRTRFVEDRRLVLPVFLWDNCIGVRCADGQTCFDGACVPSEVDPATLALADD